MDSIKKVFVENKAVTGTVIAVLSIGGLTAWLYSKYRKSLQEEEKQQIPKIKPANNSRKPSNNLAHDITAIRNKINVQNPSIQDVKLVLKFAAERIRLRTLELSTSMKQTRRARFPKGQRFNQMNEYLKFANISIIELQRDIQTLQHEQQQILVSLGMSAQKIQKYAAQLEPFMRELMMGGDISLDLVRELIALKTKYLQENGETLVDEMLEASYDFTPQQKQQLPNLLNIVMADQLLEDRPELDSDEFEFAFMKYGKELQADIIPFERVITPLMGKMQAVLAGGQQGFGGYGDQGYGYPAGGEMPGFSEEEFIAQLEEMRQTNPAAYEQFMAMMNAQGGGFPMQ